MSSLLETITADAVLRERLAATPADAKTLTLEMLDGQLKTHPRLRDTIDEPTTIIPDRENEGFVPPRRISVLGQTADADEGVNADEIEYRLIGQLGSGGTGIVYQAHQRAIDREVAVKVLRHELAADPQQRRRFLSEARVIGALDHPNVIALHDLCLDHAGHLFYSMKRIDGASWDQQIDSLTFARNLEILLRVADAIRYAHSRDLIHRDLKPENVMLGRFGEVLVADWGLAIRCLDDAPATKAESATTDSSGSDAVDANSASTRSRARDDSADWAIGGTPAYMAPEQAIGGIAAITKATDVYLLGAILFQILTRRPPHHGNNLLLCIRNAAANEIIATDVDGEWMDVAMRAMATAPEDRFESVDAFLDALGDQRTHEESARLVRRAAKAYADADRDDESSLARNPYQRYRISEALLREAIEIWPENPRALAQLQQTQIEFARAATSRGDLDLAQLLYAAAGQEDTEAAARVRVMLKRREQVRASQARYSALFMHSPEAGLLIRWNDGTVLEANHACLEMLRTAKDDLVGKRIANLSIWACPDRRQAFIEQLRRDGRIDNFETQFVPQGPGLIDVLISSRRVDVNGDDLLLSTIRDISLRKAAERELRESQRRLRDLQQLAGLGSWSYNVVDQKVVWSEDMFRVTGRASEKKEPDYAEFLDSIHPDDRPDMTRAIDNALGRAASYQMVVRYRDDDGAYRALMTRGQPVRNEQGTVVEVYGVMTPAESRATETR